MKLFSGADLGIQIDAGHRLDGEFAMLDMFRADQRGNRQDGHYHLVEHGIITGVAATGNPFADHTCGTFQCELPAHRLRCLPAPFSCTPEQVGGE